MASPLELLGINPQTGLGTNLQGMYTQQADDLAQQQGLSQLATDALNQTGKGIANQAAQLQLGTDTATQGSTIAAKNSANTTQLGTDKLTQIQNAGQLMINHADAINALPPDQRHAYVANLASQVPGIENTPQYQSLMSTSPDLLPSTLKSMGQNIVLNTGEQLRAQAIQAQKAQDALTLGKQSNDAAMARTQVSEGGANSRNAANINSQMQIAQLGVNKASQLETQRANDAMNLESAKGTMAMQLHQMDIDAGKFNRNKAATDPNYLLDQTKGDPTKAATVMTLMASTEPDPDKRAYYAGLSNKFQEIANLHATAGRSPGITIGADGGLATNNTYGSQTPTSNTAIPVMPGLPGYQQQPQNVAPSKPPAPGLPPGTKDNGDGTFTLPTGQRVRRKAQ